LGTKVFTLYQEGTFDIGQVQDLITNIGEADIKVAELEVQIAKIQEEEKTKLDEIHAVTPEVEKPVQEVEVQVVEVVEVVDEASDQAVEVVEITIEEVKDKID
jgi:predicted  nucleic acid-binding Zn-ribbon protein